MITPCTVTLKVEEKMEKPVYLYYQLDNFYQNHRRYVRSRNDEQLRGDDVDEDDLDDCEPLVEIDGRQQCGLIAASLFNDTFTLLNEDSDTVAVSNKGIAWESDVEHKFANGTSEAFIVWMRTAGLPKFKKLYGIIDQDLPKGDYRVQIDNTYPVSEFDGKKYVVLSTTGWLGGKNPFLGFAYIIVGALCILLCFGFLLKHMTNGRPLGDQDYLNKILAKGAARDH